MDRCRERRPLRDSSELGPRDPGRDGKAYRGDSQIAFQAKLSNPIPVAASVWYSTEDMLAHAGQDYVASQGTILFQPNQTQQTIDVDLINDVASAAVMGMEDDAFFYVNLANPQQASIADTFYHAVGHVLTPGISVSAAMPIVNADDDLEVVVSLQAYTPNTVKVHYQTVNQSAVGGTDYTATHGTLTFHPGGLTEITISIPTTAKRLDGSTLTFEFVLDTPVNAHIEGGPL